MKYLGVNDIQKIIPHRHPFLLLDYIEDHEPGVFAVGYKCVTYREDFFAGHFPGEPVMPGVLILEAMAQVGAVIALSKAENVGKSIYLGGINKCRFKGKITPGDTIKLDLRVTRDKGTMGIAQGTASVDGKIVAEAELIIVIGTKTE